MEHFEFHSSQQHTELIKGQMRTQVKEVHVSNGQGTVSIKYLDPNGKVLAEHKEQLTAQQIRKIRDKRFVPDLFDRCLVGCGTAAQEQTPRNAAKLRRHALHTRRRLRRNN
jgi:hypothetical protein